MNFVRKDIAPETKALFLELDAKREAMQDVMGKIYAEYAAQKEAIFVGVLERLLDRKPTEEDIRERVAIATYEDLPNNEHIVFDGLDVGYIETIYPEYPNRPTMEIKFVPFNPGDINNEIISKPIE